MLLQKFTLAWGAQAVIWGETARNAIPRAKALPGFLIGGAQSKNHMQRSHQKFSKEELFVGQRYRRMKDQKPWPGLALKREFSKGRGLKAKVTIENIYELGDLCK